MNQLTKSSAGLLYEEQFGGSISLLWDLVPNNLDRVELSANSIKLLPGDDRIELTMPCPQDTGWLFQTHVSFKGRASSESAGFILKSITDNIAECELKGDTRELYDYLKMELSTNYVFSLKASKDGVAWKDFGNSKMLDGNKFGYYINELTKHDALEIFDCIVCKGNFITISSLPTGVTVDVYDKGDNKITHCFTITHYDNHIVLDCTNLLFPIDFLKFVFKDDTGAVISESYSENIYGGDVFSMTHNVKFTINGSDITSDYVDLGTLNGFFELYSLVVTNTDNYELHNRKLSVKAYSIYNPGNIPVTVAEATTIDDTTNLVFEKELTISLRPYEAKSFYLKIERDTSLVLVDSEYRFKIMLL